MGKQNPSFWVPDVIVQEYGELERYRVQNAKLKAENEKLRLLVCGLDYCSDELNSAECDRCPLHDSSDPNLEPKCVRMMRELGIDKEDL